MSLIDWKDEFAIGIPAVDAEHRELIGLINATHEQMRGQTAPAAVGDFLWEIFARVSAHFALEERIMRDRKYDQYDDHKQDHERLLDEIRDIMDAYDDGRLFDEREFARVLGEWFTGHFRTRDARLHKHLH
jgi:hemerythrin-like metal-binding protein